MKPHRFVRRPSPARKRRIENLFRRGPGHRVRRRANAVRLSLLGYTVPQITEALGCNQQSVHNWFDAFESGGAEALFDKPRSGRPPKASRDYRARLVEIIKTSPSEFGYPFTVWSVVRLRAHMAREMDVLLGDGRIRQIMKEEGLVFKRPKHSLKEKRDPKAFASVKRQRELPHGGGGQAVPRGDLRHLPCGMASGLSARSSCFRNLSSSKAVPFLSM